MKTILRASAAIVVLVAVAAGLHLSHNERAHAAPVAANPNYLKNPQTGGLKIASISSLSFGPGGFLLVAEPGTGSVVGIETGDVGPIKKPKQKIDDIGALVASGLGTTPDSIIIKDMAVNPASGRVYLAVSRKPDNATAIITIDAEGKAAALDTSRMPWSRVSLPGGTATKVTNVTDVACAGDRVVAAGSCNEEFASKIFSIPMPMENGGTASIFSAETYHVAHGKWETRAPISSFVCNVEDGKTSVVGAFACTPIAKFPIGDLKSGAQVKGVSMVELGSGNRPLDMFTYAKGGKNWLVTHTQRFKQNLFGPSNLWAARVDMDLLKPNSPDKTNEKAVRRDVKQAKDPQGIEIVDALFGAMQADKLSDDEAVIIKDNAGKLSMEVVALP
jgi:hypothetical protein